jgi:hypothetical protein
MHLTHHPSKSTSEQAESFAIDEQVQYLTRNKLVLALLLVITYSLERGKMSSNSCVCAMTLTQSTAYHMLATSRFVDTPLAAAVRYTKHCRTPSTLVTTLGTLTSLAPTMCYAKRCPTFRTLATTLGILTSLTPAMCYAKQCCPRGTLFTTLGILASRWCTASHAKTLATIQNSITAIIFAGDYQAQRSSISPLRARISRPPRCWRGHASKARHYLVQRLPMPSSMLS